jgi:hypothetical protein
MFNAYSEMSIMVGGLAGVLSVYLPLYFPAINLFRLQDWHVWSSHISAVGPIAPKLLSMLLTYVWHFS